MRIDDAPRDPGLRQRLLEGWLPLAQESSLRYGWGLDAPALEALILTAAPALAAARSTLDAAAILWATHARSLRDGSAP